MRKQLLAVLLLTAAPAAMAADVDIEPGAPQAAFDAIAEDLVATIDYKANGPAEATGVAGFGIGLVTTYVPVDEDDWQQVTGSDDFKAIGLVGVQATKGLPFGIDVGAFYATAPGSNVDAIGGEIRYAFLEGSTVTPAVALRLAHVTVSGIDEFDLSSTSADVEVSKGFTLVTPYAGIGYVKGSADPDPGFGLNEAEVEDAKYYAGLRLSLGFFEITPQFSSVAGINAYNLRLGFSFGL